MLAGRAEDGGTVAATGPAKTAECFRDEIFNLHQIRFLPYIEEAWLGEALAAARPVIFIGPAQCEPAQIIDRAGCGIHVLPGDVDAFLAAVDRLRGEKGRSMGRAGHALFLREFNRPIATTRMVNLLTNVLPV